MRLKFNSIIINFFETGQIILNILFLLPKLELLSDIIRNLHHPSMPAVNTRMRLRVPNIIIINVLLRSNVIESKEVESSQLIMCAAGPFDDLDIGVLLHRMVLIRVDVLVEEVDELSGWDFALVRLGDWLLGEGTHEHLRKLIFHPAKLA